MIGFAGKYRLFPCDSELYSVCERRNPNYPRPMPPIIKKLPTRRTNVVANDNRNSFIASNQSPSFGFGDFSSSNVGRRPPARNPVQNLPIPPVRPEVKLPKISTNYNPVLSVQPKVTVPLSGQRNPYIQLHDQIEEIKTRRRLFQALGGGKYD